MKYIYEFYLKDKTKLVCITDGINRADGASTCINSSHKLFFFFFFQRRKFRLDKNTPYNVETWKASDGNYGKVGGKNFSMLMFNVRNVVNWNINAAGVKSAYRQVVSSLGAVPVTFIYDLGQVPQKKSSKNKAQQVIKDQKETYALLSRAVTHAKEVPGLGPYLADIPLLCSMIYDYAKGQYREVPIGTIIGCTAALIYFVSPIDMIPDFIPVVGQLDDVGVLVYALKAVHQDLQEYDRWKQGKVIQHAGA